ncbi:MAG: hypothetical protein QOH90_820 [Actinomycetota bacterium]|nr:hypothetical protein [Actinomycetota bacterium]
MAPRRFLRTRSLLVSLAIAGAVIAPAATGTLAATAASTKAPLAQVIYFDQGSSYLAFTYSNGDSGSGYLAPDARIRVHGQRTASTADLLPGSEILRMRLRGDVVKALVLKAPTG